MRHLIYPSLLLFALNCGKSSQGTTETDGVTLTKSGAVTLSDPALQTPEQKFLSLDKPGGWDKHKGDHVPFVEIRETSGNAITLRASVAFDGEGTHYTETIILINHRHQEIKKAEFRRGNKTAQAVFEFKRNPEDKYYILSKCSMHDTWVTAVALPKLKKSED